MILIRNWDNFILEKYGNNSIAQNLSKRIISILNDNIGKLILNKSIIFKNEISIVDNIKFSNDIISVKLNNIFYGGVNTENMILSDNNIDNVILYLELNLNNQELSAKKIFLDNEILNIIEHESLHIVEKYLTFLNNKDFAKSWKDGEELFKLKNKYKDSKIWYNDIYHILYLSLPHEFRAKLQQLNSKIRNSSLKGVRNVEKYIKNTKIYKDVEFISKINIDLLINKFKLDKDYYNIIKDFSIDFLKNKNPDYENNFINYIKKMQTNSNKILKKIISVSYNFESVGYIDNIINYNDYL